MEIPNDLLETFEIPRMKEIVWVLKIACRISRFLKSEDVSLQAYTFATTKEARKLYDSLCIGSNGNMTVSTVVGGRDASLLISSALTRVNISRTASRVLAYRCLTIKESMRYCKRPTAPKGISRRFR